MFSFACLLLVASGCGGDRDESIEETDAGWAGAEEDSAGVRIVSNPPIGLWTDQDRWTIDRELSIGVIEGAPAYQFGRVVDVEVGDDGRIYVLDQQAAEIRVFDPDGSHLFSFGRSGEGPGELSSDNPMGARAVLMAPAGDMFVPDQANARVSRFTSEGDFLSSFRIEMEEGIPIAWSVTPGGDYLSQQLSSTWNGLRRFAPSGEVLDTLLEFDPRPPLSTEVPREAFQHAVVWTVKQDGGLISGASDRFRIEIRAPDGELTTVVEKQDQERSLSRAEQERFLDRLGDIWSEMFRARGESEEWIQGQLRRIPETYLRPTYRPMFTGLAEGPDGTIWAQRALPVDSITSAILEAFRSPLQEFRSSTWEIFSPDGRYLGQMSLPRRFTLHRIKGTELYGVERDELGVQHVLRLRLSVP